MPFSNNLCENSHFVRRKVLVYVRVRDGLRIDYVEFEVDEIMPTHPVLKVLSREDFERLKKRR